VKPIGPNFRRFVSPTDPGDVVVRRPRRKLPSHQPKEGSTPLNVPTENPQADWMRNRTLHHYPHEKLAFKLGWAAFGMLVLMMGLVVLRLAVIKGDTPDWFGALAFLAAILANGFGIFSQMLSGGRCWIGALSMALVWICLILVMVVAGLR